MLPRFLLALQGSSIFKVNIDRVSFLNFQPQIVQELWHCSNYSQLQDEIDCPSNGKGSLYYYYASEKCYFGTDCEMPWLHAKIDECTLKNPAEERKHHEKKVYSRYVMSSYKILLEHEHII